MSEVKQFTASKVLCWIFGVLLIIGATSKVSSDISRAAVTLLAGVILLPPVGVWIAEKTKQSLSNGTRFLLALIILFIGNGLIYNFTPDAPFAQDDTGRLIQRTVSLPISTPTTSPKPPVFRTGDKVELGPTILVVNSVADCKSTNQFSLPETGKKLVIVDVTQENQDSDSIATSPLDFTLRDNQDYSYSYNYYACKKPMFDTGTLSSRQKQRGFLTFEIMKDNTPKQLIFTPGWLSSSQIIIDL